MYQLSQAPLLHRLLEVIKLVWAARRPNPLLTVRYKDSGKGTLNFDKHLVLPKCSRREAERSYRGRRYAEQVSQAPRSRADQSLIT